MSVKDTSNMNENKDVFIFVLCDVRGAESRIRELENLVHFLGREVKHLSHLRHRDLVQSLQQRR